MTNHSIWPELPIGLAGFALYLATTAVLLRQSWAHSPARIVTGAALLVYVAVVGSTVLFDRGGNFWMLSTFYWFPAVVFLSVFGAVYKSISLRILMNLLARPEHAELYSAVLARYVETESFEKRLDAMLDNSFAVLVPEGYQLTNEGRRLMRGLSTLQRIFSIAKSG